MERAQTIFLEKVMPEASRIREVPHQQRLKVNSTQAYCVVYKWFSKAGVVGVRGEGRVNTRS